MLMNIMAGCGPLATMLLPFLHRLTGRAAIKTSVHKGLLKTQ
jgi:hypothetical protein